MLDHTVPSTNKCIPVCIYTLVRNTHTLSCCSLTIIYLCILRTCEIAINHRHLARAHCAMEIDNEINTCSLIYFLIGGNANGSSSGSPTHFLPPGHSPTPSSTPVSELSPGKWINSQLVWSGTVDYN